MNSIQINKKAKTKQLVIANLMISLLTHCRIHTTKAKAKALCRIFNKTVTLVARQESTFNKVRAFRSGLKINQKSVLNTTFPTMMNMVQLRKEKPGISCTKLNRTSKFRSGDSSCLYRVSLIWQV